MTFLISTNATALEPVAPSLQMPQVLSPSSGGVVRFHDPVGIAMPAPHWHRSCRIPGARAERMERFTSNPCLAADAMPGTVCLERFGQETPSDASASATLDLSDAPCGS